MGATAFVHQTAATRVIFGAGSLEQLSAEVDRLNTTRVLVLATPGHVRDAQRVAVMLGSRAAGVFAGAKMHVPIEVAQAARGEAQRLHADALLAIGGGSTIGLAKAVALETGLPILAVPTTYAGSEMTTIHGVTEGGVKRTGRDAKVLPRTVIYDAELTTSLPFALSVTSAFNAIAHAAEGLYAADCNPVVALMAEEGIRRFAFALPTLQKSHDLAARGDALVGAWLCGTVLGATTMGLHHKLCHTLGGSFDLPHAEVHTVVLPHALAYNANHAQDAMRITARALEQGHGSDAGTTVASNIAAADASRHDALSAARAVHALARRLGAPTSLAAIGMSAAGLDRAADLAVSNAYANPRALDRAALRALLQRAYDGAEPAP